MQQGLEIFQIIDFVREASSDEYWTAPETENDDMLGALKYVATLHFYPVYKLDYLCLIFLFCREDKAWSDGTSSPLDPSSTTSTGGISSSGGGDSSAAPSRSHASSAVGAALSRDRSKGGGASSTAAMSTVNSAASLRGNGKKRR